VRKGIANFEAQLGAEHWRTGNARMTLGLVLTNQRRFAEAERELNEARRILVTTLGPEHPRSVLAEKALQDLATARAAK
jgi:hypothetical protein